MTKEPEPVKVAFTVFTGMTSNVNPHQVEPGAMLSQVNCKSDRIGELVVRQGLRLVTFDN